MPNGNGNGNNNENKTSYVYSEYENQNNVEEQEARRQVEEEVNEAEEYQQEQQIDIVDALETFDTASVMVYINTLSENDTSIFLKKPHIYDTVKRIIEIYNRTNAINNEIDSGLALLEFLLNIGCDPNATHDKANSKNKKVAVNIAAGAKSDIAIELLSKLFQNENVPKNGRGTIQAPIFDAIDADQIETVRFILNTEGINKDLWIITLKNEFGSTEESALSYAILYKINFKIAELLVQNGMNVNYVEKKKDLQSSEPLSSEPLFHQIIRQQFNWNPRTSEVEKEKIQYAFMDLLMADKYLNREAVTVLSNNVKRNAVEVAVLQERLNIVGILNKLYNDPYNGFKNGNQFNSTNDRPIFITLLRNSSYTSATVQTTNSKKKNIDDAVKWFLRHNDIKVSSLDVIQKTKIPFFEAAINKDIELLKLLVNRDFLERYDGEFSYYKFAGNRNILTYAIENNKLDALIFLLNNEHSSFIEHINDKDDYGDTPLTLAVYNSFYEIAKTLITAKADVNKANANGLSPLIIAISKGNVEIVKLLLENNANPNTSDKNDDPAILIAMNKAKEKEGAEKSTYEEIVKLLKDKGARLDLLLFKAARAGNMDAVRQLLEEGLDPTALVKIEGIEYNAYDVAPTMDIRLLLAPYFEKEAPRFRGFTKNDFALFKDIWDKEPHIEEGSMCPICFTIAGKSAGCFYIDHNCLSIAEQNYKEDVEKAKAAGIDPATVSKRHVHKKLFNTYLTKNYKGENTIVWCLKCSRVCYNPTPNSHAHYDIQVPVVNKRPNYYYEGEAYGATPENYDFDSRGGFTTEKLYRFQKLLEFMCFLNNNLIGKISENMALNLTKEQFIGGVTDIKDFLQCGNKKGKFTSLSKPDPRTGRVFTINNPLNKDVIFLYNFEKNYEAIDYALELCRNIYTSVKNIQGDEEQLEKVLNEITPEIIETLATSSQNMIKKVDDINKYKGQQQETINRNNDTIKILDKLVELNTLIKRFPESKDKLQQRELALEGVYGKLMKKWGQESESIPKQEEWILELDILEKIAKTEEAKLEADTEKLEELRTTLLVPIEQLKNDYNSLVTNFKNEKATLLKTFAMDLVGNSDKLISLQEIFQTDPVRYEYKDYYNELIKQVGTPESLVTEIMDITNKIYDTKEFIYPKNCKFASEGLEEEKTEVKENAEQSESDKVEYVDTYAEYVKPVKVITYEENEEDEFKDKGDCDDKGVIKGDFMCMVHFDNHDDHRNLYKFCHVQPIDKKYIFRLGTNPTYFNHTEDYFCKWGIIAHISAITFDSQTPVRCIDSTKCKGLFHPDEVAFLLNEPIEYNDAYKEYEEDEAANLAQKRYEEAVEAHENKEGDKWDDYRERLGLYELDPPEQRDPDQKPKVPDPPKRSEFNIVINWDTDGQNIKERREKQLKGLLKSYKIRYNQMLHTNEKLRVSDAEEALIQAKQAEAKEKDEGAGANAEKIAALTAEVAAAETYLAEVIADAKALAQGAHKQQGGAYVRYSFYNIASSSEMSPGCPLKKRVKGGYKKTRRVKKVLKTRKAKRYNRTRKH